MNTKLLEVHIFWEIKAKKDPTKNAIKKTHERELNVRNKVFSVFSLKMHCTNESDNKFILNQINQINIKKGISYDRRKYLEDVNNQHLFALK